VSIKDESTEVLVVFEGGAEGTEERPTFEVRNIASNACAKPMTCGSGLYGFRGDFQ
jgi:hypothetical protein